MDQRITQIITFTDSENYGAIFQAFSLRQVCLNFSESVEFLKHNRQADRRLKFRVYHLIRLLLGLRMRMKKTEAFQAEHCPFAEAHRGSGSKYILGSDQIWQPGLIDQKDLFYLGASIPRNADIQSYASSFGTTQGLKEHENTYRTYLGRLERISVREETGRDFLESIQLRSEVVVDPTLLLSQNDYVKFLPNRATVEGEFILCYVMTGDTPGTEAIISLAKKENPGKKIVVLGDREINFYKRDGVTRLFNCGPRDFLSLFHTCVKVYTSSFHGTCFSHVFNKPLTVCLNQGNNKNIRITNLLHQLSGFRLFKVNGKNVIQDKSIRGDGSIDLSIARSKQYIKELYD